MRRKVFSGRYETVERQPKVCPPSTSTQQRAPSAYCLEPRPYSINPPRLPSQRLVPQRITSAPAELLWPQAELSVPQAGPLEPQTELEAPQAKFEVPQPGLEVSQADLSVQQPGLSAPQTKLEVPQADLSVPQPAHWVPQPGLEVPVMVLPQASLESIVAPRSKGRYLP